MSNSTILLSSISNDDCLSTGNTWTTTGIQINIDIINKKLKIDNKNKNV